MLARRSGSFGFAWTMARAAHLALALCCAPALFGGEAAKASQERKRVALVIGNSGYLSAPPLRNTINDSRLIAESLRALGFEVQEHEDLDQAGMISAVRAFGRALTPMEGEAVGLFYYAGHAIQLADRNYLLPIDADISQESDLLTMAMNGELVLQTMRLAGNPLNFMILDACRNSPFLAGRSLGRGLAQVEAPQGTLVAYATAPGKIAQDGAGRHGPYARALAKHLPTPGLAVEQLFKRVRIEVMRSTRESQIPWESSSLTGDFYFAPDDPEPPRPSVSDRAIELAFWNSIKSSDDPADYWSYIRKYGDDGEFIILARSRFDRLTAEPERPAEPEASPLEPQLAEVIEPAESSPQPAESSAETHAADVPGLAEPEQPTVEIAEAADGGSGILATTQESAPPASDEPLAGSSLETATEILAESESISPPPAEPPAQPPPADTVAEQPAEAEPAAEPVPEPESLSEAPQPADYQVAMAIRPPPLPGRKPPPPDPGPWSDEQPQAEKGDGGPALRPSPAALAPGARFRDCEGCPEMVVLPAGRFLMGSGEAAGGDRHEGPVHEVRVAKPFAMGRYEVTFEEWDRCVADGGCAHRPKDFEWGRGRMPVVDVSWQHARAYADWLSRRSGARYRLPSEAEWEYAANGGARRVFPWGNRMLANKANCWNCGSAWDNKQPAKVGSFEANAFGVNDLAGNVWEWTEDCWNGSYEGAPGDGSAWLAGNCAQRVLKGGAWMTEPEAVRIANRNRQSIRFKRNFVGFRVVRELR